MRKCPMCGHIEPEPSCCECGGTGWVTRCQDYTVSMTPCPKGCPASYVTHFAPSTATIACDPRLLDFTRPKEN